MKDYWLHVEGRSIKSASGGDFVPAGLAHCKDILTFGPDSETADWYKTRHCNVVRLSSYCNYFNNHRNRPFDINDHIENFVDPFVRAAKERKLYVIIDNHEYLDEPGGDGGGAFVDDPCVWSEKEYERFKQGWEAFSRRYRDEPWVMGYELCNEPVCKVPLLREQIVDCIRRIRKIDKRHILFVPSNDWTHARALWNSWASWYESHGSPDTLQEPQVVHTFHEYPDDNNAADGVGPIDRFQSAFGVPVMMTEFGSNRRKSDAACEAFLAGWFTAFKERGIGWSVWPSGRTFTPALGYRHEGLWIEAMKDQASAVEG